MRLIYTALVIGSITLPSKAQIVHSKSAGGRWHESGTWVNGVVPTEKNSSHIYIDGPVTIDASVYSGINPLTIDQLEITTGALSSDTGSQLVVNGVTTVSVTGIIDASGMIIFGNNISVSGTLIADGAVEFAGNLSLTGTGTKKFHDILVSGMLTPNAIYTITGNITVAGTGALLAGANTTFIQGNSTRLIVIGARTATFNNLTVMEGSTFITSSNFQTYGTLQVSGTLTVDDGFHAFGDVSVAVDTGIVFVNNKAFAIDKGLTVSSGAIFLAGPGVDVHLNGNISASGDLTLPSKVYLSANTTMTGGGRKIFGDVIVTGTFKPASTLTIRGNLTLSGSGTLVEGTSTTTFTGPSSEFSNNGTGEAAFHNVLVADGATLTNDAVMIINGTFRSTGSFIAKADVAIGGTCTISRGGSFVTQGAQKISLGGNLAISGVLTADCAISFNGNTKITGAGSKQFSDVVITGSLTSYNGSMTISGSIVNDGIFIHNNGTIVFTGNNRKSISSTLVKPLPMNFYNVTLIGGTAPTDMICEMDVGINGALVLNTATNPATIDVDGSGNDKTFTLRSTNDEPAADGSIGALPSDAIVQGVITVERFMSGEGRIYRYLASPVQGPGATVADWQNAFPVTGTFADPSTTMKICFKTVQTHNASLYYYLEPEKSYVAFPSSGFAKDNLLTAGRGYAAFVRACDSTIIRVAGELTDGINRGSVLLPVTHTEPVTSYNNLVGNPLPSAIDWDLTQMTNVSSTIAIRDNGAGVFRYYTKGGAGATDLPNGIIAQGQAFWVRSTGPLPSLTVNENSKVAGAQSGIFYKVDMPSTMKIRVSEQDHVLDQAYVVVNPVASSGGYLDAYDAPKLNNQRDDPFEELPDLYTAMRQTDVALAVNAIPSAQCGNLFSLFIRDLPPGNYTLTFIRAGELSALTLTLIDNFTKENSDATTGSVSIAITSDSLSRSPGRFQFAFNLPPAKITLENKNILRSNYQEGNRWFLDNIELNDSTDAITMQRTGLYRLQVTSAGCGSVAEQYYIITGVSRDDRIITVYPNPVTSTITIENLSQSVIDLSIIDLHGRVRYGPQTYNDLLMPLTIDLHPLPEGIYFMILNESDKKRVIKIVKR